MTGAAAREARAYLEDKPREATFRVEEETAWPSKKEADSSPPGI